MAGGLDSFNIFLSSTVPNGLESDFPAVWHGWEKSPETNGMSVEARESCRIKYFWALCWGQSGVSAAGGAWMKAAALLFAQQRISSLLNVPSVLEGDFITTKIRDPVFAAIFGSKKLGVVISEYVLSFRIQ